MASEQIVCFRKSSLNWGLETNTVDKQLNYFCDTSKCTNANMYKYGFTEVIYSNIITYKCHTGTML